MQLLAREHLIRTGPVDHADWNYRRVLGLLQRRRFRLALDLLGPRRYGRLLEIGYGSGVFLPQLTRCCDELHGIDVHPHHALVSDVVRRAGVEANLTRGSAASLPFDSESLDAVVSVSALEFVDAIDDACREVARVLRSDGVFVVVTPGCSAVVDLGLRLLTGQSARTDYGARRERVIPALRRHFDVARERRFLPRYCGLTLYHAFRLHKRP